MSSWQHFQHMADIGVHGFGASLDVWRHHPAVEIKGATYTELHVWHAQCVVDV